jgi:hypothetical protein
MPRGPKGEKRPADVGAHDGQRNKEIAKKAAKTRWVI